MVGVVGDVYGGSLRAPPAVAIYYPRVPIPQSGGLYGANNLVVKTAGSNPMTLFPQIRAAALDLDPNGTGAVAGPVRCGALEVNPRNSPVLTRGIARLNGHARTRTR